MKLKLIISVVIIVVIGILCVIFVPKIIKSVNNEKTTDAVLEETETTVCDVKDGRQILYVKNFEEVDAVIKEYKWTKQELDYGFLYLISNAEIAGTTYNIYLVPSEEDSKLVTLSCDTFLFPEDYKRENYIPKNHSGEEVKNEIRKFLDMIDAVFGVRVENRFTIVSNENRILSNEDNASYEAIWKGEAVFDFLLQDADGYFWTLQSGISEEGAVYLSFTKYLTASAYDGNYPNVIVRN